jgi:hypothetical protein
MLKGRPLAVQAVTLPGTQGVVYVRELDGLSDARREAARYQRGGDDILRLQVGVDDALWTLFAASDAAGKPLFAYPDDLAAVQALPASELRAIAGAAAAVNAGTVEQAAKNS